MKDDMSMTAKNLLAKGASSMHAFMNSDWKVHIRKYLTADCSGPFQTDIYELNECKPTGNNIWLYFDKPTSAVMNKKNLKK
jgi:hypothetical protein